ncbi:MAG: hypothetical protein KF895_03155 [Parvibaculum sp.]|nr:hypothetical protein [Parvibaculum sp.]
MIKTRTTPAISDAKGEVSFTALIAEGRVTLSEMGAEISADLSFQEYQSLAHMGQQAQVALPWIVGDVLAFGAKRFPEIWEQAVDFTDRSNETLRKWKTVAEAFPMERRRFKLKHTYYQAVAFLSPAKADELLGEAERDRSIKSDDLRKRVQALSEPKTPRLSTQTPADDETVVNNQSDAAIMDGTSVGQTMRHEAPQHVERPEFQTNDRAQWLLDLRQALRRFGAPQGFALDLTGVDPAILEEIATWFGVASNEYTARAKRMGTRKSAPKAAQAEATADGEADGTLPRTASPDNPEAKASVDETGTDARGAATPDGLASRASDGAGPVAPHSNPATSSPPVPSGAADSPKPPAAPLNQFDIQTIDGLRVEQPDDIPANLRRQG